MILLVLVVLWAAVLGPGYLESLPRASLHRSIDSFPHSLHLLERSCPKIVQPAYRLETARSDNGVSPGETGYPALSSTPGRANLVLLRPVGEGGAGDAAQVVEADGNQFERVPPPQLYEVGSPVTPRAPAAGTEASRRQAAQRRRRDVLCALLGTFLLTAVLGSVHSLRILWVVALLSALALAGYVALIAYARQMAAEQRLAQRQARSLQRDPGHPGVWEDGQGGWYEDYREPARQARFG